MCLTRTSEDIALNKSFFSFAQIHQIVWEAMHCSTQDGSTDYRKFAKAEEPDMWYMAFNVKLVSECRKLLNLQVQVLRDFAWLLMLLGSKAWGAWGVSEVNCTSLQCSMQVIIKRQKEYKLIPQVIPILTQAFGLLCLRVEIHSAARLPPVEAFTVWRCCCRKKS